MQDISRHINILADRIYALKASQSRIIVGIAGPPGSGKSTIASELSRRLSDQKNRNVVVPMDGFHLDNAILDARGLRPRKGAPETFDVDGFLRLLRAIRGGEDAIAPLFDRTRDIAIAGAVHVPADCPIVIVEGNYLLLDQAPWSALAPLWDVTAYLDVPMPELRARLIQRWLSLNLSRTVATRRAESNDIPNAQRVRDHLIPAEFMLSQHGV